MIKKYVVIKRPESILEEIIIFSTCIKHSEFSILEKNIISAGFVILTERPRCYGFSSTLGLNHRDSDVDLLKKNMEYMIVVEPPDINEMVLIISETLCKKDIIDKMNLKPISAGIVSIGQDIKCGGRCEILNLDSRPKEDLKIITDCYLSF